jgi:hypothetical protein
MDCSKAIGLLTRVQYRIRMWSLWRADCWESSRSDQGDPTSLSSCTAARKAHLTHKSIWQPGDRWLQKAKKLHVNGKLDFMKAEMTDGAVWYFVGPPGSRPGPPTAVEYAPRSATPSSGGEPTSPDRDESTDVNDTDIPPTNLILYGPPAPARPMQHSVRRCDCVMASFRKGGGQPSGVVMTNSLQKKGLSS